MNEDQNAFVPEPSGQAVFTGLSVKRANRFFLLYAVLSLALGAIRIPGVPATWLSMIWYVPVLVIAVVLCRKEKLRFGDAFGFFRVRPLTILLTVVICIAMHSVSHLASSLTNLLFPSIMDVAGSKFLGGNFFVDFIGVAVIPAFFEEFIVRGGVLHSYLRTGRMRAAVLLTALLFGLMHMNATQLFYSFVMGIVLALLFVLTGSIWPGILFHFLNNGMAPVADALAVRYGDEFVSRYIFPLSRGLADPKSALITVAAALGGLAVTVLCLRGIARSEGSRDRLRLCVRGGGGSEKLVTPALIIAMVLLAAITAAATYGLMRNAIPS